MKLLNEVWVDVTTVSDLLSLRLAEVRPVHRFSNLLAQQHRSLAVTARLISYLLTASYRAARAIKR